jgi:hypothetical protein
MSEIISVQFPDISGDVSGYTAFLRNAAGTLLNAGGDAITETGSTGRWTFTLAETRAENTNYYVRIYSGSAEAAEKLAYDGILRAGFSLVDEEFEAPNKTLIRGTVGSATTPSTTSFTPSSLTTLGTIPGQWRGRILMFDNTTTTAGLRGRATIISDGTAAALPLLTYDDLLLSPANGDTFVIL